MIDDLNEATAAARRVLETAQRCFDASRRGEITSRAMLLALASEPEGRAADILARHGIDAEAIGRHWPELVDQTAHERRDTPPAWGFPQIRGALHAAVSQAGCVGPHDPLTPEHLLLALVAGDDETADWLRQRGLHPDAVAEEIRRRLGGEEPRPAAWPDPTPLSSDEVLVEHGVVQEEACRGPGGIARPNLDAATVSTPDAYAPEGPPQPTKPVGQPQQVGQGQHGPAGPRDQTSVLRVLDAAANRATEALRTIEDFARFVLDDQHLTELGKQLRHDLVAALHPVPTAARLAARDTALDVGTSLTTPQESRRATTDDLLTAAFARLQEALRTLEEFGKLGGSGVASAVKQLRYRSYTLHRAVAVTHSSMERLAEARLYVLIDGGPSIAEFESRARSLVEAGVHILQLRDKRLADRELLDRARRLRAITRTEKAPDGRPALFVVNDRPDVAVLSRADGVHVGQEELCVKDVRAVVGPEMLVGVSTHSIEQARQAVIDGANYIGCGPTFPSATKQFEQFPGLELLRQIASEIRLPAFAIGGIALENVGGVLETGVGRVAVGAAITHADDPAAAARALLAALASDTARSLRDARGGVME